MRVKLFVSSLLGLALLAAGAPDVWSQQRSTIDSINAQFRYSVKFVCGQSQEPKPCLEFREAGDPENVKWICPDSTVPAGANGAQAVKGLYATAINVHNPALPKGTDDGTVVFAKKVAIALPWQKSGPVSHFERAVLRPNHAFEIDCEEIAAIFLNSVRGDGGTSTKPPFPVFLKGFLVIMSPAELDVTAVYTARGGDASTMDVEVIEPRKQEGVVQADVPATIPSD